jgi:ssDNA-binding replication factor A large subunit
MSKVRPPGDDRTAVERVPDHREAARGRFETVVGADARGAGRPPVEERALGTVVRVRNEAVQSYRESDDLCLQSIRLLQ